MTTKLIADRAAVIRSLTSSVDQHADAIARPLEQLLFPDGVPRNLTVEDFLHALAAAAAREYGVLAAADIALASELSDDSAYRDEREDARADLRVTIQRSRGAMVAAHGERVLVRVGLAGEMPESSDELVQIARAAAGEIESAELGTPLLAVDRDEVAAQLLAAADRVQRSHADLAREEREAQEKRTARDEADATVRRVYSGFADAFAGLAYAVLRDDVASRVRPTARRRAGLPEQDDVLVEPPVEPTPEPTV